MAMERGAGLLGVLYAGRARQCQGHTAGLPAAQPQGYEIQVHGGAVAAAQVQDQEEVTWLGYMG